MATRRAKTKRSRPDVEADVRTAEAIRAAFARNLPAIAERDLTQPLTLPSDEEWAAKETFTLFVWACVDALFDTTPAERPRAFSEWSAEQRALLEELAKLPAAVLINAGDLSDRVMEAGAMTVEAEDPRYLLRYVGLVEPGPLERVVDERPLWLWLRLCLMGKVSSTEWSRAANDLDAAARIELARLAVENAYQLLRRWPFPRDITPAQEDEDTASLFEALVPVLAAVDDAMIAKTIRAEAEREHPNGALVVLLATMLVERGGELAAECDDALVDALPLYSPHGRRLVMRLAPARRSAIVSRMEPVAHNARGFWTYADLLEPEDRDVQITTALSTFTRRCKAEVAARVKELVRDMSAATRAELRARTADGPNAALVAEATAVA
ncbi:MAG TPA: hypothetical protein VG755_07465 [Nannocystaceae bacterium]|nr:hypothetical protein [Nannocystaceae bacterium]